MTMIERVAQAIAGEIAGHEWEDEGNASREFYRNVARTAITAMREPTPVMRVALLTWLAGSNESQDGEWKAMIDAALNETSDDHG